MRKREKKDSNVAGTPSVADDQDGKNQMADEQNAKRLKTDGNGQDIDPKIFSHLPTEILHNVLVFLPIRQAVISCTVAVRFKKVWRFCKNFCFDEEFSEGLNRMQVFCAIKRIFRFHEGPKIKRFRLCIDPTGPIIRALETWLIQVMDKDGEEIELDFSTSVSSPKFSSPAWFDYGTTLTSLSIDNCEFKSFPSAIKNWRLLTNLSLRSANVTSDFIYVFLDCCFLLECLDLVQCYSIAALNVDTVKQRWFRVLKIGDCENLLDLEVNAPTMKSFHYSGNSINFKFGDIRKLEDVLLSLNSPKHITQPFKLVGLVFYLYRVTVLSTTSTLLEGLCRKIDCGSLKSPQFIFHYVKELQLFMNGLTFVNTFDIANFLRSCPNVEKLFIDLNGFNFATTSYWELHQKYDLDHLVVNLTYVKFIKISGYKFDDHEIELVTFLLKMATNLENLVLVTPLKHSLKIDPNTASHYRTLFYSMSASKNARVSVYEPSNDPDTLPAMHTQTWFYSLWASK